MKIASAAVGTFVSGLLLAGSAGAQEPRPPDSKPTTGCAVAALAFEALANFDTVTLDLPDLGDLLSQP
jgi:hypothetical protein